VQVPKGCSKENSSLAPGRIRIAREHKTCHDIRSDKGEEDQPFVVRHGCDYI